MINQLILNSKSIFPFLHSGSERMGDDDYGMMSEVYERCDEGGFGFMNSMMGGGMMMILFLALIAIVIYVLVSKNKTNNNVMGNISALEVLEKEFAKGNISEEEFVRKRDLLK